MKTSGFTGNATKNHVGEPSCSDSWACGELADSGPSQTNVLVARIIE